ncbi:MAG: hypothetical protein M3Q48_13125, partial [Actinomycetota bacterium]|nr:hypothetical protein [Actinomycetota bacterium]
ARRAGGLPERRVATRVVAARPSVSGRGYYLLAGDGAVHTFGDAAHHGGATGQAGPGGVADMAVMR